MKTRLTLKPGQRGTEKMVSRYGDRLVRVRYRYDERRGRRLKTVELIVDETDWEPGDRPATTDAPERRRGVTAVPVGQRGPEDTPVMADRTVGIRVGSGGEGAAGQGERSQGSLEQGDGSVGHPGGQGQRTGTWGPCRPDGRDMTFRNLGHMVVGFIMLSYRCICFRIDVYAFV